MRFLLLFVAVSLISSCGTKLPPVPRHTQMAIIEKVPLDTSHSYNVPYYSDEKAYRETIRQFLDKKPVCVSANDYGKLKKYAENVLAIIKQKCPALVK